MDSAIVHEALRRGRVHGAVDGDIAWQENLSLTRRR